MGLFRSLSACVEWVIERLSTVLCTTWEAIDDYMTVGVATPRSMPKEDLSVCRFVNTALSFFDDYRVINGVPVFVLEPPGHSDQGQDSNVDAKGGPGMAKLRSIDSHPVEDGESSTPRDRRSDITHSSFSMDGTRLLTGHKCGDVCVWDAEHGKLTARMSGVHKCQILACHFIGPSKNSVASIDQSCSLVIWNLITGATAVTEVARGMEMQALDPERCEIAFSHDGSFLALTLNTPMHYRILRKASKVDKTKKKMSRKSRKTMSQEDQGLRAAFLDIYKLDYNTDGGAPKRESRLTVAWRPETPYSLNGVQFADNGNGLLVGMYSSDELMPGYVVAWPDWRSSDVSLSLSGSLGSWSKDGNLVVTWDPFIKGTGHESEKANGTCFVWDIVILTNRATKMGSGDVFRERGIYLTPSALCYEEMIKEDVPIKGIEETPNKKDLSLKENFHGHPELSPRYIADEFVFECMSEVLWARFVWAPKGKHRLATCSVDTEIRLQIWKVEKKTLHLTLTTGIERSGRLDNWAKDFVTGNETESVAVSPDQCWLGLYVEKANKGFIWNAVEGVRLLNIYLPDGDLIKNYNLSFGGCGCRMAMTASTNFLLWDIGALSGAERRTGKQMDHYTLPDETHDGSLVKALSGKDRRGWGDNHPVVDLKFSLRGDKLGILRRASSVLHVQDFEMQGLLHLKEAKRNSSNFQAFNFSRDGSRLVGVLGDGSVHLWNTAADLRVSLGDGLHFQHPMAELGRLDGYFHGASGVVFSVDETGKEMVVVCDDGGTLVWLDTELCVEVHRLRALNTAEGALLTACQFKADGSSVVLHTGRDAIIVIDVVSRKVVRRSEFAHHVQEARSFPDNVAGDSSMAVAGWDDITNRPIVCRPGEHLDLSLSDSVYMNIAISEDGTWLVKDDISSAATAANDKGAVHIVSRSNGRVLVMPVIAGAHTKELRTDRIPTPEVLAISVDGRRIACAGSDRVAVWTPYATKGCVPDYYTLDASGLLSNKKAFEAIVMEHGPALMNRADAQGLPLILSAIDKEKVIALKVLLKYCQSTRTRPLFFTHSQNQAMNPCPGRGKNAVALAIERRLPDTVLRLIRAMYDGVVSRNAMAGIFKETLVPLGRHYPSLFLQAISGGQGGHGMPVFIGKIAVPERLLEHHGFVAETFPKFLDLDVQKLWSQTLPVSRRHLDEVMAPAQAQAYPYPGCCKVGMNGLLRPLLVSKGIPDQAFKTSLVHSIITYKWQAYAHKMVVKEAITYFVFVILFTTYAIVLGRDTNGSSLFRGRDGDDITELVLLAICAIFALFNLKEEFHQLRTYVMEGRDHGFNGLACWALSKWNALEICSSTMVAFVLPIMQITAKSSEMQEWQSVLVAMTAIAVWWKLLYFATPFKATGPLVIVIFEVIKDIFFFVFLLAAILFGFSVAFFLAFRHDVGADDMAEAEGDTDALKELEELQDAFGEFQKSLFTTFGMMLGEFDLGLFYGKSLRFFPRFLFVVYMVIMMVMMLNLLISLMGFSFERVKQSEETTFLKARALVIDDVESMANSDTKKRIEENIHEYLHTIVPKHSSQTGKQEQQEQQELQEKLEKLLQLEQTVRDYGSTLRNELMGELRMLAERQKSSFVGLKEAVEERLEDTSNILIGEMRRMLSPREP